jgi:hypothetical protein
MDIYQYINSKDIREHLQNIGYQFNALEAAWLVYECRNATMEEKHAAWREIIETMPDMRVEFTDDRREPFESLHQLLRDYMAMKQRWLKRFLSSEPDAVYRYLYYINLYSGPESYDFIGNLYTNYDDCIIAMKKESTLIGSGEIALITIGKRYSDGKLDHVTMNSQYDVLSVSTNTSANRTEERLRVAFYNLWFAIPTPFQKGDIVYDPGRNERYPIESPFVFTETAADIYKRTGRHMYDGSDMTAWGYFQKENGTLYEECMHHYMDLELYPEEKLTGKKRILKALGNHLKGEIDAVLFARAYHQILLEESARESLPRDITDEGMQLAGLKPNNIKEGEE